MAKIKYRFNPESLSYEAVNTGLWHKFKKSLLHISAILITAIIFYFAFSAIFDTPKEKGLKRENKELVVQYDILNKKFDLVEKALKDIELRDNNIYRVIFEAEPIPSSIRNAGFGGINRYTELANMKNSDIILTSAMRLDKIAKKVYVQSKSYDEIINLAENKKEMLSSIPAIQPISNKNLKRTASGWGYRIHPIYKIRKFHKGMDFIASTGTDVYATGDGKVVYLTKSKRGLGNHIIIDHGFGYKTIYAHLSNFNVKKGQRVKRGDVIGFVGNSGLSTAPHLHYEVHKNNKAINPINFYFEDLNTEEYERMIIISSNSNQTFD
ncbi:M23 family metallopeptidase [Bacteroidota bacterium]